MYGKDYYCGAWYLSPKTGGMADNDICRAIFALERNQWKYGTIPGGLLTVGSMPKEIWTRIAGGDLIPSVVPNGDPVTFLTILWSHQDVNADAVGGELMYLDDVSLKIDAPIIEPSGPPVITDIVHDLVNDIVTLTYEGITDTTYAINLSAGLTTVGDPSGWKNSAILRSLPKPLESIRTLAHRVQE
jgi:hypothetical protein